MQRKGDFFFTQSGVQFWPLDPRPEEINIEDIAHGLSHVCRWGGHCRFHFSVASHSILVAEHLPKHLRLQGLMHDATEAYLGDMIAPIKRHMPDFQIAEAHLWIAICEKWNLPYDVDPLVVVADVRALETERRQLCHPNSMEASSGAEPFAVTLYHQPESYAKRYFLDLFRGLTEG